MDPSDLAAQVAAYLAPRPLLLHPRFQAVWSESQHPLAGHCYVASEALYHLLGGAASGWVPCSGRDERGVVHWWLERRQTREGHDPTILDPTAAQYTDMGRTPPYIHGRRRGFLTKQPSKRAVLVIAAVTSTMED